MYYMLIKNMLIIYIYIASNICIYTYIYIYIYIYSNIYNNYIINYIINSLSILETSSKVNKNLFSQSYRLIL